MYAHQQGLTAAQSEALVIASQLLIERCLADITSLAAGDGPADIGVLNDESVLPPSFRMFYDSDFASRLLATLMTVSWKLRAPEFASLGCAAEEMAFSAIVSQARSIHNDIWELRESETIFDEVAETYRSLSLADFEDIAQEDEDFKLLWDKDSLDAQDVDELLGDSSALVASDSPNGLRTFTTSPGMYIPCRNGRLGGNGRQGPGCLTLLVLDRSSTRSWRQPPV